MTMVDHACVLEREPTAVPLRPRHAECQEALAEPAFPRPSPHAAPPRVLIVEDDHDLRWCLAELASTAGLEVDMAADGTTALELIERGGYALVVSDLRLPGQSGMEVGRAARRATPTPEVILMTAFPDWCTVAECAEFRVLRKPLDLRQLARLMAQLPDRSPAPGGTDLANPGPREARRRDSGRAEARGFAPTQKPIAGLQPRRNS